MKYSELQDREFFTFFNLTESDENRTEKKTIIKNLKPGGFQEYIDIQLMLNSQEEITQATISLERSWTGNADSLNPFAKDIVKSFIKALTPIDEIAQTAPLVDALFHLKGLNDKIISINSRNKKMDDYPPTVMDFIDVYRNLLSSCKYELLNSHFIIKNKKNEGKESVIVRWTANCD
jgi:hypothetical protein